MSVKRFDSPGTLEKAERTPQGGIKVPANLTRVGVLLYREPGGAIRREFRPPDEVFSTDSLATLAHAPVTDGHPPGPVTPENFKAVSVGHVAEDVRPNGQHVSSNLLIQDAPVIAKIDASELKELSCGYVCDLDETPGIWQGEPYDAVQRNIRYNHVALGPSGWGRAGASVSLRLDARDAIQIEREPMKDRIDGIEYTVGSPEWLQARAKHDERVAKEHADTVARADAAEGTVKAHEVTIAKLRTDLKDATDPKTVAAKVAERAKLVNVAKRVYQKTDHKFDAAAEEKAATDPVDSVMSDLVGMIDPSIDLKGKSADYVNGVATALIKSLLGDESKESAADELGSDLQSPYAPGMAHDSHTINDARRGSKPSVKNDSAIDEYDSEAAYKRMVQDSRNAHMMPLNASRSTGK